jgi:hypothetical protein
MGRCGVKDSRRKSNNSVGRYTRLEGAVPAFRFAFRDIRSGVNLYVATCYQTQQAASLSFGHWLR